MDVDEALKCVVNEGLFGVGGGVGEGLEGVFEFEVLEGLAVEAGDAAASVEVDGLAGVAGGDAGAGFAAAAEAWALVVDYDAVVDGEGPEGVVGVCFSVRGGGSAWRDVAAHFRHAIQGVVRDFPAHVRIGEDLRVAYGVVLGGVAVVGG